MRFGRSYIVVGMSHIPAMLYVNGKHVKTFRTPNGLKLFNMDEISMYIPKDLDVEAHVEMGDEVYRVVGNKLFRQHNCSKEIKRNDPVAQIKTLLAQRRAAV